LGANCIDQELIARAEQVVQTLKARKRTAVTAESCTAGLIAAVLSHVEGAGEVLEGAHVAYSKEQKAMALDVDPHIMTSLGTVNDDVIVQMTAGALAHSKADIALAVSGVLGPSPDEDGNPVGLVFLAAQRRGEPARIERQMYGTRPHDELRRRTVLDALALLESEVCE
jgi:nicotinamide-nucleotide amidase